MKAAGLAGLGILLFVAFFFPLPASPQIVAANTLGELLRLNGVQGTPNVPPGVLESYIGNGDQTFRSGDDFIFAGYLLTNLPGAGVSPSYDRIHVIRWNGKTARYAAISPAIFSGSISRIVPVKDLLYISTHLNPSAGITFVLGPDLRLQQEVFGVPISFLSNDFVVFYKSEIHFAPTHAVELLVYDPARRVERKIYPPRKPDPVRSEFVDRVRAAYALRGEEWFRANNHHMNPEAFDSALLTLVKDDKAHAIAFLVDYQNPINDANDPRASGDTVVVTCTSMDRVDQISCRERSLDSWTDELKLSKPSILRDPSDRNPLTVELLKRAAAYRR